MLALYVLLVVLLSWHGLHRYLLAWQWWKHRDRPPEAAPLRAFPRVTVQLPVYNERDVVGRLVDAAAALDWPADRLQIQLLDDSSDDTPDAAAPALARARRRGLDVLHVRRRARTGYKAAALAEGLRTATGEFIAIFDADFVPAADFLRALVPHFADPGVGMVQARWGHLNRHHSSLTEAQAVLLDGHFVIEHTARNRSGAWFNFNGTAGVWRRTAIEAAGGWQHDTLTEDLDLSYRAQLAGWRFVYVVDHVVPAELPETMNAFRGQQRRWAKGSVETARKLGGRVLASAAPWRVRLEALVHLHANLAYPLALAVALVLPAVVLTAPETSWSRHLLVDLPGFLLATSANGMFYALSQGGRRLRQLPAVMALGLGMAVSQSVAVSEALLGRRTPFIRTPKRGAGTPSYLAGRTGSALAELLLAALHLGVAGWAAQQGHWGSVPFLLLFGGGFAWVGGVGAMEALPARAPQGPAESVLAK
jgi:hypothetical protein